MKLYTKEDFLKAAEFCEVSMIDAKYIIERIDEVAKPIVIPSDREIHIECKIGGMDTNQQLCFQLGAKWVRDKIGGNK